MVVCIEHSARERSAIIYGAHIRGHVSCSWSSLHLSKDLWSGFPQAGWSSRHWCRALPCMISVTAWGVT